MPQLLQTFAANDYGQDYMVGDIHGCFYMLDALLDHIGFDPACDRLFSVGDLIDRGPDSERAAVFLDQPWFHTIRGNHEQMLLNATPSAGFNLRGNEARRLWEMNGGDWFKSLSRPDKNSLRERIAELPYAIEIALPGGNLAALVHADVPEDNWLATRRLLQMGNPDNERWLSWLLWERDRAMRVKHRLSGHDATVAVDGIDLIGFGHTPLDEPVACTNTRWLDTGAVHGNQLSIAKLALDGQVWSLDADMQTWHTGWRCC